ncbi:MAG: acyl-CoA thioesterase [Hyphomonadaceae bacterium]
MSAKDTLTRILTLDPIEVNLFRGFTPETDPRERIFGGQVVAQALLAAYKTIDGLICHSLQSYFIRPGDPNLPVLYQVERSRDGRTFATRRVIAIQKGEQIFNMACSFQREEAGFEHQSQMPAAPHPDDLIAAIDAFVPTQPARTVHWLTEFPIEIRPMELIDPAKPKPLAAPHQLWFRSRADMGDDLAINQALLAYASDMALLGTGLRPHGVTFMSGVQTASLDHILWFHRRSDLTRWHLYVMDSPSASGARGFNVGAIYREDGVLVASAAQEGLMRQRT